MTQNKKKVIKLFVGNISNYVVHKILEEAINEQNIRKHYEKEYSLSFKIAVKYREKLNPAEKVLPMKESTEIKKEIIRKTTKELKLRIKKGYEDINLERSEKIAEEVLKKLKIK